MGLAGQGERTRDAERGYAMAALLVGLSVMAVLMTVALPVWSHAVKREKEEELIWRGNQYSRAIGLFQRKFANTFPPSVDVLVEQRFLRKKYKDPITNDDFQLLPAGGGLSLQPGRGQTGGTQQPGQTTTMTQGQAPTNSRPESTLAVRPQMQGSGMAATQGQMSLGIGGVVSKSKDTSIKIYNGRQKYNEWAFVYMQTAQAVGPGGVQAPGGLGGPGGRGGPQGGRGGPGGMGQGGFPGLPGVPGPGMIPGQGGRGFNPMNPGQMGPGGRPPVPMQPGQFGQPPFGPGQPPSPFGQPFGMPGQPTQRPRPPGD